MKYLIALTILIPLLFTSCASSDSEKSQQDVLKAFKDNNYNFSNYKKIRYKGIKFKLPNAFEVDYGGGYTYKPNAFLRRQYQLGIIFTVEKFTKYDINSELMEDYLIEDEKDFLNSFHDAYSDRRYESLHEASISYKKVTKKNIPHKGITQVVAGRSSSSRYSETYYYAMTTLKVKDDYYVFQMITAPEMMHYVFDDFERILATVRAK